MISLERSVPPHYLARRRGRARHESTAKALSPARAERESAPLLNRGLLLLFEHASFVKKRRAFSLRFLFFGGRGGVGRGGVGRGRGGGVGFAKRVYNKTDDTILYTYFII